jgi:hypothetical protein
MGSVVSKFASSFKQAFAQLAKAFSRRQSTNLPAPKPEAAMAPEPILREPINSFCRKMRAIKARNYVSWEDSLPKPDAPQFYKACERRTNLLMCHGNSTIVW